MNKIWFFGDSFCDTSFNCETEDENKLEWTDLLARDFNCNIAHLGTAGSSIPFLVKQYLENLDFIQPNDIVVFVYTSVYREYFKGKNFRPIPDFLPLKEKMDSINVPNENNPITEREFSAWNNYLIHLYDIEDAIFRGAMCVNYLLKFNHKCKTYHIPAFADFPHEYCKVNSNYCITEIVDDLSSSMGLNPEQRETMISGNNHMVSDDRKISCVKSAYKVIKEHYIDNDK